MPSFHSEISSQSGTTVDISCVSKDFQGVPRMAFKRNTKLIWKCSFSLETLPLGSVAPLEMLHASVYVCVCVYVRV